MLSGYPPLSWEGPGPSNSLKGVGTTSDTAPRWDMTVVFPSPDSREFAAAHEALGADLDRLVGLYDRYGVRGGDPAVATVGDLAAFDEVITATNALLDQARTLNAYLSGLWSTDARNDQAATLHSQL